MPNSNFQPIDRTLSGATTLCLNGPRRDGNEELIHIPQSFYITGASPSDCLVQYSGYLLGKSYPSAEMQFVYSAAPGDLPKIISI